LRFCNAGVSPSGKRISFDITGTPDVSRITTGHVEKQNHTLRIMHCWRLTRLTNAFSKKLENFKAAIALNFAYYNLVETHGAISLHSRNGGSWSHLDGEKDGPERFATVLEIPPVVSAETVVRVQIVKDVKAQKA
jgi:hypothetical protein